MPKAADIERKWYVIDAAGKPLGRVAAQAATLLRGKHKPTFAPHADCGDHVIIINCGEAVLTGKKLQEKAGRGMYVALLLFVGIPLPGTGAWTGTLAASILDLDFKKSILHVVLGILLAGIIMTLLSQGVKTGITSIF